MANKLISAGDTVDYTFDWQDFLEPTGSPGDYDTIATSTWSISPTDESSPSRPDLTSQSATNDTTNVFVASCTRGTTYRLINTIVTAGGRTGQRSITLRCEW